MKQFLALHREGEREALSLLKKTHPPTRLGSQTKLLWQLTQFKLPPFLKETTQSLPHFMVNKNVKCLVCGIIGQ